MEDVMKVVIFLCLLFWPRVFGSPVSTHKNPVVEHIVVIDKNHPNPPRITDVLSRLALHEHHPTLKHIYNNTAFHGFAATMESHCLDKLAQMDDILIVEQATHITTTIPSQNQIPQSSAVPFSTRDSAPWGLERISTASGVGGNPGSLNYTYAFGDDKLGAHTDIYIIDTGVYTANQVFGGRAQMLWSFDGNMTAVDGHGTHVSGIAGGALLGVASNANILGLKALSGDGGGSTSDVIKAIDLALVRHNTRLTSSSSSSSTPYIGAVISMSLASPEVVPSLNHAILTATQSGIHAVVAAGNNGGSPNACSISPASAGGSSGPALTVGAIDITASLASFSNYGSCVDVYAPGVDVISAWIGSPDRVASLSGTSMATPHVTGLVAYAMSANKTLARDPAAMKDFIRGSGVRVQGGLLSANNGVHVVKKAGRGRKSGGGRKGW